MLVKVYNKEGQETAATVELPDAVFGIEPNTHAMYLDVKQYLAHQRQGTHKAKERSEMSGSTRKLHKQKGTGGARKGDINNPLYKGGARVFGPKPRDYSFKLNKKVKALARRSALSQKAAGSQITVLEDFTFETPKTSAFARFLSGFQASNQRVLVVTSEKNEALVLSSRNLQKARVVRAEDLNTYELMKASRLLLMSSSVGKISQHLNP